MNIREKLITWAVSKVMETYFNGYVYPFSRSDAYFNSLSEDGKASYAFKAKELLENEVFDREMQEVTRKFYQELAINSKNLESVTAYRLTLSFVQQFHQHLRRIATHTQSGVDRGVKGKVK